MGEVRCHDLSAASRRAPCLESSVSCGHEKVELGLVDARIGHNTPGDYDHGRTLGHGH